MVRIRMSARMYPLKRGIIHITGIRVPSPLPWAKMPIEFCRKWRLVVQEVEQPRISQVLKVKREQYVYCWGCCVGLWEVKWIKSK